MKTFFLSIILFSVCALTQLQAQTSQYYNMKELANDLNLTREQATEIMKINKGIDKKFAEIGKDRSLTGKQKWEQKQRLAVKHKQNVLTVLTPEQKKIWYDKYDQQDQGIKNSLTDKLDEKLDDLEYSYEKEKAAIRTDNSLTKQQKKEREAALKANYKKEKEQLKSQKKNVKRSVLLTQ